LAYRDKANERLSEMKSQNVIRPARQPIKCCSRMELVPKGPNDFRIVIDYRGVNKTVMRAPFPLPIMNDYKHKLFGATWFAKVDLSNAFHHTALKESSIYLTTFMTEMGPMKFTRLPFGMNASPEQFQRIVTQMTADLNGIIVLMDDFLVFGKTKHEMIER
jgi:Reverse transcriptase (RNA-dependent DNA polymerase)